MPSRSKEDRQHETFAATVASVEHNRLVMASPPILPAPNIPAHNNLVRVEVINANGTPRAAARMSRKLAAKGLRVVRLNNAKSFNAIDTVVYFTKSQEVMARQLAKELQGKAIPMTVSKKADYDIRVVLGQFRPKPMI